MWRIFLLTETSFLTGFFNLLVLLIDPAPTSSILGSCWSNLCLPSTFTREAFFFRSGVSTSSRSSCYAVRGHRTGSNKYLLLAVVLNINTSLQNAVRGHKKCWSPARTRKIVKIQIKIGWEARSFPPYCTRDGEGAQKVNQLGKLDQHRRRYPLKQLRQHRSSFCSHS